MGNKIKVKESIYVLEESDKIYSVIFTSTRKIKKFKVDGLVKDIISNLGCAKEESTLIEEMSNHYDGEDIKNCLNSLESEGILRRYGEDNINKRASRQILFIDELTNSWEETLELQRKIEGSVVSVFGVGGIGTWIVNGLYQIGVGEIRITDPDKVELSNANRQLFFTSEEVGKYKADVVKEKIPDTKILAFKKKVSEKEDLEEIVVGSDFLVNCADSPSVEKTTRIIDSYARRHKIPYCVAGGYNMHLGMVGPIIIPGETASFNDFLENQKSKSPFRDSKVIKNIEKTGSLGPIAGAVANIQVMEIFKYLTGKGKLNLNRFAEVDFLDFGIDWNYFKAN